MILYKIVVFLRFSVRESVLPSLYSYLIFIERDLILINLKMRQSVICLLFNSQHFRSHLDNKTLRLFPYKWQNQNV